MRTKYIWLMGILLASMTATAQTKPGKTAYNDGSRNSYDHINIINGKRLEHIQMEWKNKTYKMALVDNNTTELYVDGEKIPAANWSKYSDATAAIRKQIRENQEQAKRNEEQAGRNEIQAKKNQEQVQVNELQAKRNQEQAVHNQEQAEKNQEQVKVNEVQNVHNEEQAKRNEEQSVDNQEQAKRNEEQSLRNQEQAKRNEEQAAENERFIKGLTEDLVNDKIIPDANSLHQATFNSHEMIVNGVKQPDAVFKRYKEKYPRISEGEFTYSRDGLIEGK
jgi:colicin import membrane protein